MNNYPQHLFPKATYIWPNNFDGGLLPVYMQQHYQPREIYAVDGEAMVKQERPTPANGWVLGIYLMVLCLVAWVRIVHYRKLRQLFTAVVAKRFARQTVREERPLSSAPAVVFSFIFVFMAGLFLFQVVLYYQLNFQWQWLNEGGVLLYLACCLAIFAVYLVKVISIRLVQFLFKAEGGVGEYIFTVFITNHMLGLLLIPVTVSITYMTVASDQTLFYIGFSLLAIAYVYRVFQGIITGITHNVSTFYLFLYLCTLEILPLVVIMMVFMGKIQ